MEQMNFEGKKVLVIGAASGIGRATSASLSKYGATLICVDQDTEGLARLKGELTGNDHGMFWCDVSQLNSIEGLCEKISSASGPIDGIVFCVGMRSRRPLSKVDYNHLQGIINTNFISFIEFIKYFTRRGRYNNGLSIVGISSISAHRGSSAVTAYAASKAALESSVRCLARELHSGGIRVNTVVPGQINTPAYEELKKMSTDDFDPVLQRQYLGLGEPQDVANSIIFLLSEFSRMITGTSIPVDGGFLTT